MTPAYTSTISEADYVRKHIIKTSEAALKANDAIMVPTGGESKEKATGEGKKTKSVYLNKHL